MPPSATAETVDHLDLLRQWREPFTIRRFLRDGVGSIVVHVLVISLFLALPKEAPRPEPPPRPDVRKAVRIVAPRFFEPTQKEPNKGKVTRELDVRSVRAAAVSQAPRLRAPQPVPGPAASS